MTAPAAPTTGPTPNNMPGASTTTGEPTGQAGEGEGGEEGEEELTYEDLSADRDKWKGLSQKAEKRAKSNAEKAKQFDGDAQEWKKSWEREQAAKNATKTPEQIKAEADAEYASRVADADARAAEAEAKLLRSEIADGQVPAFMLGLITATAEEDITEQVSDLKEKLDAYVGGLVPDGNPRRPQPNPVAGRTTTVGSTPQQDFAAAFAKLL